MMTTKPDMGLWYDRCEIDKLIRNLIKKQTVPSSKGFSECPDCMGTLLWARDYQGFYYVRCWDCNRLK